MNLQIQEVHTLLKGMCKPHDGIGALAIFTS